MAVSKYKSISIIAFSVIILIVFFLLPSSKAANIIGANNRNVTLHTSVNITNSRPEVLAMAVYQDTNSSMSNITLSAGSTRLVTCNASFRDWNGYNDIVYANATLWYNLTSSINSSDNNNSHYTVGNCTTDGNGVNYTVNYGCNFSVYYYANNGTWNCNVTVMDTFNTTGIGGNTTYFYPVYALNVTDGLDFGNAQVNDITHNASANITNFGNMPINISVEGYGSRRGDGLAMNCSLGGNITVANERFSIADIDWTLKSNLSSAQQLLTNLTVAKQTLPGTPIVNSSYWQLYVDSTNNPGGNCTGFVVFMAQAP